MDHSRSSNHEEKHLRTTLIYFLDQKSQARYGIVNPTPSSSVRRMIKTNFTRHNIKDDICTEREREREKD